MVGKTKLIMAKEEEVKTVDQTTTISELYSALKLTDELIKMLINEEHISSDVSIAEKVNTRVALTVIKEKIRNKAIKILEEYAKTIS